MPIRTLIILALAVAALSGCGRRGDVEAPRAAVVEENAPRALPADGISPLDPGAPAAEGAVAEPEPEPSGKPRRFFLDFLL